MPWTRSAPWLADSPADFGLDDVTLLKPIRSARQDRVRRRQLLGRQRRIQGRLGAAEVSEPVPQASRVVRRARGAAGAAARVDPVRLRRRDCRRHRPGRTPHRTGEAMAHVAGYTVCNEGTVRDWCRHGKFNVTAGKNFAHSGAIGPFFVTTDEVGDAPTAGHHARQRRGATGQTTDRMIFSTRRFSRTSPPSAPSIQATSSSRARRPAQVCDSIPAVSRGGRSGGGRRPWRRHPGQYRCRRIRR